MDQHPVHEAARSISIPPATKIRLSSSHVGTLWLVIVIIIIIIVIFFFFVTLNIFTEDP